MKSFLSPRVFFLLLFFGLANTSALVSFFFDFYYYCVKKILYRYWNPHNAFYYKLRNIFPLQKIFITFFKITQHLDAAFTMWLYLIEERKRKPFPNEEESHCQSFQLIPNIFTISLSSNLNTWRTHGKWPAIELFFSPPCYKILFILSKPFLVIFSSVFF